jgi:methyl-accepting chemotaxis protein
VRSDVESFTAHQAAGIYPLFSLTEDIYTLVVQNHAIIESETDVVAIQRHHNKFTQFYEVRLKDYEATLQSAEELMLLDKFKNEFVIYQNVNKDIIRLIINGRVQAARELLGVKEISAFEQLRKTLDVMYATHYNNLMLGDQEIRDEISKVRLTIGLLSMPILFLVVFIGVVIFQYLRRNYANMREFMTSLNRGVVPTDRLVQDKTEIGVLNKQINETADIFKKLTLFSHEIAQGIYDTEIGIEAPDGSMAKSLLELRNRLSETQKEETKRHLEDEQRNWTTQGLAKFGDIMRHSNENISSLSDEVIKNLVHYINASQGGLFIFDDSDPNNVFLEMQSAFAYDRKKYLTKKIALGDGLVGMCALEKNTLYITDVPSDYMEIESGLGDSKPKSLLIVPLKSEDKILGVIELASFNLFEVHEIQFVEQLGDSIASTLASLRNNTRTADLLKESQLKTDELAVREQELHKAMNEMTLARDEAQRREAEMSGILSAIDETLLKAELDPEGKFESANQKYLSALGYRKDELIGRNIRSIMSDEYLENFDIVWQNICAGQSYQKIVNQKSKNGDSIWLLSQYTPIFDQKSNVVRILYMANDITEQKTIEEKNKQLLAMEQERAEMLQSTQESMAKNRIEMTSVLTAIDETLMRAEYSVEGSLLSANSKHIKTMGYDFEQTKGKNILTFIPDEEIVEFKALWQNVCEGNLHQMTVKRKSKLTGKDIWLINQYTPVRDTDGKVIKVLFTAFDITVHKEIEEQAMRQVEILKHENEDLGKKLNTVTSVEEELKYKLLEIEKISNLSNDTQVSSLDKKYKVWLESFGH